MWRFSVVICILVATACQGPMPISQVPIDRETPPSVSTKLGPGDEIEIKFAYAGDFNETQRIRPDGKIELQLVGEIQASGKTPDQLRQELTELYGKELKYPQLAVIVRTFHGRRVYVGGEVTQPGVLEMPDRMTVFEAIMEAGGYRIETAAVKSVVVVRQDGDKNSAFLVDLEDAISGRNMRNVYLQPRDIVYVSRTGIKNANQWMQNHLWDFLPSNLPVTVGVGF